MMLEDCMETDDGNMVARKHLSDALCLGKTMRDAPRTKHLKRFNHQKLAAEVRNVERTGAVQPIACQEWWGEAWGHDDTFEASEVNRTIRHSAWPGIGSGRPCQLDSREVDQNTQRHVDVPGQEVEAMIVLPRLRVAEDRGYDLNSILFRKLASNKGYMFMPDDYRETCFLQINAGAEMRVVAEFVAGVTDRHAIAFCRRLVSDDPVSIFKDL